MSNSNGEAYGPKDAASLRRATAKVIDKAVNGQSATEEQADNAAKAVLSIARSGYARDPVQDIDADDLAEAAIARMRAMNR